MDSGKQKSSMRLSINIHDTNGNMSSDKLEIKSGNVTLVNRSGTKDHRTEVFVRVYRTPFEHYAVVYQNKLFCKASLYVNLKTCCVTVDHVNNQISISPDDAEGSNIVLETDDCSFAEWRDALCVSITCKKGSISPKLSPVVPRSPVMQPLFESEEDDDDDDDVVI